MKTTKTKENINLINRYNEVTELIKELEEKRESLKSSIVALFNEAEKIKAKNSVVSDAIKIGDFNVIAKVSKSILFDSAAFKLKHADIYKEFKNKESFRLTLNIA